MLKIRLAFFIKKSVIERYIYNLGIENNFCLSKLLSNCKKNLSNIEFGKNSTIFTIWRMDAN